MEINTACKHHLYCTLYFAELQEVFYFYAFFTHYFQKIGEKSSKITFGNYLQSLMTFNITANRNENFGRSGQKVLDKSRFLVYNITLSETYPALYSEKYRSGHNEAVLKTV